MLLRSVIATVESNNTKAWVPLLLAGLNAGSTSAIQNSTLQPVGLWTCSYGFLCMHTSNHCMQLFRWAHVMGEWPFLVCFKDPLGSFFGIARGSLLDEKGGDRAVWKCVALLGLGLSKSTLLNLGIQFFPRLSIFSLCSWRACYCSACYKDYVWNSLPHFLNNMHRSY